MQSMGNCYRKYKENKGSIINEQYAGKLILFIANFTAY